MRFPSFATSTVVVLAALLCLQGKKPQGPKLPKELAEHFAWIPPSATSVDSHVAVVKGLFVAKHEVRNGDYMEFLRATEARGDSVLLRSLLPDTLGWRRASHWMEVYIEYYLRHPAFKEYPVVGVSHAAAVAYCHWLEERINAMPGLGMRVLCRLPTRDEWAVAGRGGGAELNAYPWGNWLTNADGAPLCKYRVIGDEHISSQGKEHCLIAYGPVGFSDRLELYDPKAYRKKQRANSRYARDLDDVTVPVNTFPPNGFGLCNMSGNVAEMIDSAGVAVGGSWINTGYDVRILSTMSYDRPEPWIGFRPVLEIVTP